MEHSKGDGKGRRFWPPQHRALPLVGPGGAMRHKWNCEWCSCGTAPWLTSTKPPSSRSLFLSFQKTSLHNVRRIFNSEACSWNWFHVQRKGAWRRAWKRQMAKRGQAQWPQTMILPYNPRQRWKTRIGVHLMVLATEDIGLDQPVGSEVLPPLFWGSI